MRPVTVSVTGAGSSSLVPLDYSTNAAKVALGVKVSGTVNSTIQHTFDNIYDPAFTAAGATWYSNDDPALVGLTTNVNGNYMFVPRACRILQNSGSGTTTLTVIQQGIA